MDNHIELALFDLADPGALDVWKGEIMVAASDQGVHLKHLEPMPALGTAFAQTIRDRGLAFDPREEVRDT